MINLDEDGYPSDCTFLDHVGPTEAWDLWNDGEYEWERVDFQGGELHDGSLSDEMGLETPISGGYGKGKIFMNVKRYNTTITQL